MAQTDNAIVINAPFQLVWDMTNDVANWPSLFSEYASAEILATVGGTTRFRLTMHPDEEGRIWSWVSERTADQRTKTVQARRVEPGPFEYMNIAWTYRDIAEGVEMRWTQEFRMRPDAPASDGEMTKHLNGNTAIQMKRIKNLIEEVAARTGTEDAGHDR